MGLCNCAYWIVVPYLPCMNLEIGYGFSHVGHMLNAICLVFIEDRNEIDTERKVSLLLVLRLPYVHWHIL